MILTKDNVEVGVGVTLHGWSDCVPYTIVRISGQRVYIQKDTATRLTEPIIIPGGFAGVCVNNADIKYDITPNPDGRIMCLYPKKTGAYYYQNKPVTIGRNYFYDYNF